MKGWVTRKLTLFRIGHQFYRNVIIKLSKFRVWNFQIWPHQRSVADFSGANTNSFVKADVILCTDHERIVENGEFCWRYFSAKKPIEVLKKWDHYLDLWSGFSVTVSVRRPFFTRDAINLLDIRQRANSRRDYGMFTSGFCLVSRGHFLVCCFHSIASVEFRTCRTDIVLIALSLVQSRNEPVAMSNFSASVTWRFAASISLSLPPARRVGTFIRLT